jgi:hypothetical protein
VAHNRLRRVNQKINKKKRQTNRNKWNIKNEDAKGPSFLNQKTVFTLWYVKWSFLAKPHPHLEGSWLNWT